MSSIAQQLRSKVGLIKSKYRVDLEELTTVDMYYTDGSAQNCDFKLLFSEDSVVVAIFYVYPGGEFFGTDTATEAKELVEKWINDFKSSMHN